MDNQTKSSHGYHRRNNKRNANRSVEPEIMDSAISSESIGSNGTVNKSLVDVISHEATVNLDAQQRLYRLKQWSTRPIFCTRSSNF